MKRRCRSSYQLHHLVPPPAPFSGSGPVYKGCSIRRKNSTSRDSTSGPPNSSRNSRSSTRVAAAVSRPASSSTKSCSSSANNTSRHISTLRGDSVYITSIMGFCLNGAAMPSFSRDTSIILPLLQMVSPLRNWFIDRDRVRVIRVSRVVVGFGKGFCDVESPL